MGFLTMPQLVLSAAIGGSAPTDVLCAGAHSGCDPNGPEGAVVVPESTRRRAVAPPARQLASPTEQLTPRKRG